MNIELDAQTTTNLNSMASNLNLPPDVLAAKILAIATNPNDELCVDLTDTFTAATAATQS